MQHDSYALDDSLAFLLSQAARASARDLQARLQPFGVTPPQFCVLTRLWEEDGLPASALAERAGFDAPTTTGILDRLERQGLIVRRRPAEDRRLVLVYLTARGAALRAALPRIARESDAAALAGFDGEEAERLHRGLRRVAANLG